MTKPIGMREMNLVFAVIDRLEISREAVQVPLMPEGAGDVRRLANGRLEIVLPATDNLEGWLPTLEERLRQLGAATIAADDELQ